MALLSGAPMHLPLVRSVVLSRPTFWREFGSILNHTNPSFAGSRCSLAWYGGWDVSSVMLARIVRRAQGCLVLSRRIKVSVPSHTLLSTHLAASASCPSSTLNLDIVLNAYTVIDAAKRPVPSSDQSLTTDVSTSTTGQQKRTREQTNDVTKFGHRSERLYGNRRCQTSCSIVQPVTDDRRKYRNYRAAETYMLTNKCCYYIWTSF